MGIQRQWLAEDTTPTRGEMIRMERISVLDLMPARFDQARRELEETRNILNRAYRYMIEAYAIRARTEVVKERRQLQQARIYVKPARAEWGKIVIGYTCRSQAGSFAFTHEDAERRIRELIAEYGEHAKLLLEGSRRGNEL